MMWQCHVSSSECRCYRLNGFSLLKRLPLSAGGSGRLLEQSVGDWLEHIGLPQYESKLLLNGFDDLRFMVSNTCLVCMFLKASHFYCYCAFKTSPCECTLFCLSKLFTCENNFTFYFAIWICHWCFSMPDQIAIKKIFTSSQNACHQRAYICV